MSQIVLGGKLNDTMTCVFKKGQIPARRWMNTSWKWFTKWCAAYVHEDEELGSVLDEEQDLVCFSPFVWDNEDDTENEIKVRQRNDKKNKRRAIKSKWLSYKHARRQ